MRYVFISDVHGEFDKMMSALKTVNFNEATDTLVTLGDLFDRGKQSREVLEYVMSLPNYIPIWGNHDYRLRELVLGTFAQAYDISNGVAATLQSFCDMEVEPNINLGLHLLKFDPNNKDIYDKLWDYFYRCRWAIEFPNLIGTHAWLPFYEEFDKNKDKKRYFLIKDWRERANDWYTASWAHTEIMLANKCFPDKDMIVGHWHAWRIAEKFDCDIVKKEGDKVIIDCNTYIYTTNKNNPINIIFIDGCSNYECGGKVNIFVYESNIGPIFY